MKVSDKTMTDEIRFIVQERNPDAKVILYGSRARGDARLDSDWDILVLLDQDKLTNEDQDKIAYPLYDLGVDKNALISVNFYTVKDWEKRNFTCFYKNIEKEGIIL